MQSSHCRKRSNCSGSNSANTCSTGPRGEDGKVFERVRDDRWLLFELWIDDTDKDSCTGVTRSGVEAESVRVSDVKGFGFGFGRVFVCIYEDYDSQFDSIIFIRVAPQSRSRFFVWAGNWPQGVETKCRVEQQHDQNPLKYGRLTIGSCTKP